MEEPVHAIASISARPELCSIAIHRFFFDYVLPPHPDGHPRTGFLSHLPTLFNESYPDSALANAVTAAALANHAGRTFNTESETLGLNYYVSALNLMGQAIQDPIEVGSIETLLTSFVLGLYEIINPPHNSAGQASWTTHRDGSSLLLSLRELRQFEEVAQVGLLGVTFVQMIMNCLAEGKRPPVGIDVWADVVNSATLYVFEKKLLMLMHKTADIAAKWLQYRNRVSSQTSTQSEQRSFTEQILDDALSLDSEFEDWDHHVKTADPEWSFIPGETQSLKPWEKDLVDFGGGPFVMHQYGSMFAVNTWNLYRATRVRLNGVILRLTQYLAELSSLVLDNSNPVSKETQIGVQNVVRGLTDDICSSVIAVLSLPIPEKPAHESPHDICGARGYHLLWPLVTAKKYLGLISSANAMAEERWIENVLRFIQFHLGIGIAQTDLHESAEI
ncbi:MAG: hypothetical protein M1821_007361 [Bathelium mastoideum]|nr:MAG: hypothetical protein M1821_007361 [Bathelium mastoideum]